MGTPTLDLAVGVASASLDNGLKQLHTGHRDLLRGDRSEVVSGVQYSLSWDLREPPRISLGAPDPARWEKTWKQAGVSALPSSGLVQLVMPELWLRWAPERGAPRELSCSVAVPARLLAADGALRVELLGVWMETPPADGNDRTLLRRVLVPRLLKLGGDLLKRLGLSAERIFGRSVDLTLVLVDVTDRHLVVAAASQPGSGSASALDWPSDKEVFCLASPALVKTLVGAAAQREADKRARVVDAKETVAGVAEATLQAYFHGLRNLRVDARDPARLTAGVDIAWKGGVTIFPIAPGVGCALVEATQNM
ncbi:hypothetical protein [Streptomyces sp. CCM_MD2014]|uniref:hypothetical protein n=1 Tax=Streptomyces sp. CCM_MD2014 TaxID=1561022 RepID=UPI00052A98A2|nr:hypothetical protein [Streptomyces sp. CCM_MD2014]AIV33408.1 hypothetical protein NI25_07800 [Streptomyces sp. CCM_MD2014]